MDRFNVTLSNNIFVKAGAVTDGHADGALRSAAPNALNGWHASFAMRGNIIVSAGPAPIFSPGSDAQWALSTFDHNVYWLAGGGATLFPDDQDLEAWQKVGCKGGELGGQDKHSALADPRFKDAAHHDFTLLPSSPALKLGFRQVDMSTVGPRRV